ncbi:hypothetical protein [Saprospira grandis]|uniref:hypothetical protein n=1 Tax=Saprospira grandis TaxID=1008 RepID=UPI0022DE5DDA|nr:hypothetical protein [Saprospira grandis]WBM74914.1 hypothetical protein OP864_01485 [Saprospira grandis]
MYYIVLEFRKLIMYKKKEMTVQAQETLKYRGDDYLLIGAPLYSYLENHKEIEFEPYRTDRWNGYQGTWLLQDNKLYLVDLESANYTIQDIFKTTGPVFADWFSGQLQFGIGNFQEDHYWGCYDNYVWLRFEKGKVVDKKIVKNFKEEVKLEFGKYKGRFFKEVVNGKIGDGLYKTIREYIECLLEVLKNERFEYKVLFPRFNVTEQDVELIREIRNYGIDYLLTQNFIAVSSKIFYENSNKDELASRFSRLVEKILCSDFTKIPRQTKNGLEIAEKSILINGDLEYLSWALKNVSTFTVPPKELGGIFLVKVLKTISVKRLNNFVFEYKPVFETREYAFSESILALNISKFEATNSVKYDSENQIYLLNLTDKELMDEFGYFLDENHSKQDIVKLENHFDNYYSYENYDDYDDHYDHYDRNNWLEDAAGTDDPEVMNAAYWNMD